MVDTRVLSWYVVPDDCVFYPLTIDKVRWRTSSQYENAWSRSISACMRVSHLGDSLHVLFEDLAVLHGRRELVTDPVQCRCCLGRCRLVTEQIQVDLDGGELGFCAHWSAARHDDDVSN